MASKEDEVAAKEAELAAKDTQLSASLREAAEINEEYINELTTTQQQLESEVADLTSQLEAASDAAAHKERQEADVQAAHKRLRAQAGTHLSDIPCLCSNMCDLVSTHGD